MESRLFTLVRRVVTNRQALSRRTRIIWTKFVIAMGFLCGFLLSRKLWVSTRFFPLVPVIDGLPRISYPLDYIYFATLLVLLLCITVSLEPRIYIAVFVTLSFILFLLDQSRWQPWVYQYVFMLAAIGFFSWKSDDTQGSEDALNMCRLIVAFIYFYSGLQKTNLHFVDNIFPKLIDALGEKAAIVSVFGWAVPFLEMTIGVGLLTRRFRNVVVLAAVTMHFFILTAVGPFGHKWNSVIWPWNLAMMAFLFLLFWRTQFSFRDVIWRNRFGFQKVILLLFGIMPLFSFVGWWDSYLSFSLYSGNVTEGNIVVSEAVKDELPAYVRGYVLSRPGKTLALNIYGWSVGELNVPPYPEKRIYRRIGSDVCRLTKNSPDVALYVREKITLLSGNRNSKDTCFGTLVIQGW
jgi:hypothetical protein